MFLLSCRFIVISHSTVPLYRLNTTPAVFTIATVMNIDILSSLARHLEKN